MSKSLGRPSALMPAQNGRQQTCQCAFIRSSNWYCPKQGQEPQQFVKSKVKYLRKFELKKVYAKRLPIHLREPLQGKLIGQTLSELNCNKLYGGSSYQEGWKLMPSLSNAFKSS